jgi:DNA invertase Pin-like site-specific DNA recombinase
VVGPKRTEAFEGMVNLAPGIIAERTRDGVAAARAEGRHPGRPKLDQEKLHAALTLIRNGMSPTKAARHVGLGRSTLYRELALIPGALPGAA